MSRYFTRPKAAKAFYVEDDIYDGPPTSGIPTVCDHEATDTGIMDANGNTIWRLPNPVGFQFWEPPQ